MKPTKQLILAFRQVADGLERGTLDYKWSNPGKCNCGLLASALLGVDTSTLNKMRYEDPNHLGCWTGAAEAIYCQRSGLPTTELFKLLESHGLEQKDYKHIELLGGSSGRDCPQVVAAQFNKWADELEQRRKDEKV